MRLAIVSDLHLEFRNSLEIDQILNMLNTAVCDHVVIAGDFANAEIGPDLFKEIKKPFTFVHGNHDYYHGTLTDDHFETEEMVCASLWTNFWGSTNMALDGWRGINDEYWIKDCNIERVIELNKIHGDFIRNSQKKIVVSHFPPSMKSLHPMYAGSPMNPYFINNQDDLLIGKTLWFCGHTHHKHSYIQHDCQVIANPLGYPGEVYARLSDYQPVFVDTKDYA